MQLSFCFALLLATLVFVVASADELLHDVLRFEDSPDARGRGLAVGHNSSATENDDSSSSPMGTGMIALRSYTLVQQCAAASLKIDHP